MERNYNIKNNCSNHNCENNVASSQPRTQAAATAAWFALVPALLGLMICTFLLCDQPVQQFLPLILPIAFAAIVWLFTRLRFVRRHGKLFLLLGVLFAIGTGVALHFLF